MLDAIDRFKVDGTAIVGDAFARPLLEALDANPGRWDISSLLGITSSGVMWSEEIKRGLLRHHPTVILRDALGSSESIGHGQLGVDRREPPSAPRSSSSATSPTCSTTRASRWSPAPATIGRIAVRGHLPVGYYKDEEKTARTFIVYDGVRWSIPGDYATVEADGTIALLGRGSVCINTGGEKVFPEEVEEALKSHPEVRDAVCVGVPDTRFGEAITAMVEPAYGHSPAEAELISWVKERLAHYKAPKRVLQVDSVGALAVGEGRLQGLEAARAAAAGTRCAVTARSPRGSGLAPTQEESERSPLGLAPTRPPHCHIARVTYNLALVGRIGSRYGGNGRSNPRATPFRSRTRRSGT